MIYTVKGGLTLEATCPPGSNEADLFAGRSIAAHSGGMPDVLVVTTTVGVLHRVHGHTTHLRQAHMRSGQSWQTMGCSGDR